MKATSALREIADLTAGQWGLVTTAQARGRGVSRLDMSRLAEAGHLERLTHGVYREVAVPSTPYDEVRSIWLSLEPEKLAEQRLMRAETDVAVAGPTAAWLQKLGNLQPAPYEFATSVRRQSADKRIKFRLAKVQPADLEIVEGLPTTNSTRTVADLLTASTDLSLIAQVVADSQPRPIDFAKLIQSIPNVSKHYGFKSNTEQLVETLQKLAGTHSTQILAKLFDDIKANIPKIETPTLPKEYLETLVRFEELGRQISAAFDQPNLTKVAKESQQQLARNLAIKKMARGEND
jgi:hypothetical protein